MSMKSLKGRRVLIAEDDLPYAYAVTAHLRNEGAEVAHVSDARAALLALEAYAAEGVPIDLVLIDAVMPGMSGLAAITRMRQTEYGKKLLVIAMSVSASDDMPRACVAAGADGFMAKPVDFDHLMASLAARTSAGRP